MSTSRRRPDTGRLPSNRFQIFQHNEADCCPKIPLRAHLPSPSSPAPSTSFFHPFVPSSFVAPPPPSIFDTDNCGSNVHRRRLYWKFRFPPSFFLPPTFLSSPLLSVVTLADCSRIILEPDSLTRVWFIRRGRECSFLRLIFAKVCPRFLPSGVVPQRGG